MARNHYKLKGFTEQELKRLKEISFTNMVNFYYNELNSLINGEKVSKVLSKGDRRVLRRLGIVKLRETGSAGRILEVTPKAQKVLKSTHASRT